MYLLCVDGRFSQIRSHILQKPEHSWLCYTVHVLVPVSYFSLLENTTQQLQYYPHSQCFIAKVLSDLSVNYNQDLYIYTLIMIIHLCSQQWSKLLKVELADKQEKNNSLQVNNKCINNQLHNHMIVQLHTVCSCVEPHTYVHMLILYAAMNLLSNLL